VGRLHRQSPIGVIVQGWGNLATLFAIIAKAHESSSKRQEQKPGPDNTEKVEKTPHGGKFPQNDVEKAAPVAPIPRAPEKPKPGLTLYRGAMETEYGQIGELVDDQGRHVCWVCEDVSRLPDLKDDHSNFDEIVEMCDRDNPEAVKVYGKTAISAGLYKIGVRHDRGRAERERLRYLDDGDWHRYGILELIDVPGYTYIQLHPGNWPKDTLGCPLVGGWRHKSVVLSESRKTYKPFYKKFAPIADRGDLWIRIVSADKPKLV